MQLGSQRAQIGAVESRLNFITSTLREQEITYREAAGQIQDVDVAEEVSRMVAAKIRTQAAAVLSQANSSSEIVLLLLKPKN